ncbi:hypothetical protein MUY27_11510 [Mucilaginibacter sp. RS28]|uniref:Uncharacterized protein n=1 Tax=Mucilaginibacter straminoryzae TaxID=2932774 RepID=A0A9X1X4E3_9SPHI|nr:hypothetical protein [Mucilaginibacter straminoryzae]MCJ8210336.1 hypothetical protein [Mucilaginibacter straminoryzae]
MPFPFSVSYTKRLKAVITDDNLQQVLDYIQKTIVENKGDNVLIQDNTVSYGGTTGAVRGSLFGMVDGGMFSLVTIDRGTTLYYKVVMRRNSILSIILATIFAMGTLCTTGFSQSWLFSLVAFIFISCGNAMISWFMHEDFGFQIVSNIDRLIGFKDEVSNIDKKHDSDSEKLKSWF